MRIVILTQYYPPETGAPQARLSDLAERLVSMGHEVSVLTAMPNYPAGRIQPAYRGSLYRRETRNGVTVHRTWLYAAKTAAIVPRLTSYFTFMLTSLIAGLFCLRKADWLVTESPPLFLGITGVMLAKAKGASFALNVSDLWPQAAVEVGAVTNRTAIRAAEALESWLYRTSSLVTAQTRGLVASIERTSPRSTVRLITNGADIDKFHPSEPDRAVTAEFGFEQRFVAGYAGIHGLAQALHSVVDAAASLRDLSDVRLAFFGDGPLKVELQERARRNGGDAVLFFPLQPSSRMPAIVSSWHVGVVPLFAANLGRSALPSKMFEIMSAGVPIVLAAPAGEATALMEDADAGVVVAPEDPVALAAAIRRLHGDAELRRRLGANGRAYIERHYDRRRIAERFAGFLREASAARGERPLAADRPGA